MTPNGPSNPNLPDEADLLAWVEGEPLSTEANAAVANALLRNPALARTLEMMRSDRMAMQTFADERAPAGLIASVESALQPVLERELLLGLQDGEPTESNPVVSMVRPERRGIFQTFLADRAGRRMALAASLLVLIGGATWWAAMTFSGGTSPSPIGPIAVMDKNPDARETVIPTPPGDAEPATGETSSRLAMSTDDATAASEATVMKAGPDAAAISGAPDPSLEAPSAPTVLAATEVVGPVRAAMDAALAAELARERKLVIRVVSRDASTAPRKVCDRIRKECNSSAWKLATEVPTELAVALDAKPFDLPSSAPRVIQHESPAFAGFEPIAPIVGPPAPIEVPVIEEAEPQPVYLVQARLDAATMSQLRTSLERAGRGDEVVFEERYEPLPLAPGGAPVLTPQAVLWWTNPPAGWTSWGEVPVVIEPN